MALYCLCFLAFIFGDAQAATWTVHSDGSGDFATIQSAVTAAVAGDIIVLTSGTFTGPGNRDIDLFGKAITLRSQSGDPDSVIIDCQGGPGSYHRGFTFHSGETSATVLLGMTIANGHVTSSGGGVSCTSGSAPLDPGLRLHPQFRRHQWRRPLLHEQLESDPRQLPVHREHRRDLRRRHSLFQSSPSLTGCLFQGNVGPFGGGFACYRNCAPELTDCVFEFNESAHGAGVFSFDSSVTATGCRFEGNVCLAEGGGFANFDSSPTVADCVFIDNIGVEAGGGFYAGGDGFSSITGSTFAGNSSNLGGGVYSHLSNLSLAACTLVENTAAVAGSGIYVAYTPTYLEQVIIAFGQGAPAIHCGDSESPPVFSCCDIYGNAGGDWAGCVSDQLGVAGNISIDPLFCDITTGDFTLHDDSPCAPGHGTGCALIGAWPVGCGGAANADPWSHPGFPMLLQSHPNPFNPTTLITYRLPVPAVVTIRVFDVRGNVVRNLETGVSRSEGMHSVRWDGHDDSGLPLSSGTYFCRLGALGRILILKMLLMK